jgi:Ca-activated chloride channel homolog
MRYQYGEYDGSPYPTPESLFPSPQLTQFILQYGEKALDALDQLQPSQDGEEMVEALIEAGLLERDESTGQLRLTPKMVRGLEHRSLLEIFRVLQRGQKEGHPTQATGRSDERTEGSKPYEFGDPLSELDLATTLRNALGRLRERPGEPHSKPPIRLRPPDLEIYQSEGRTSVAMCMLLDMSGSMMRYGRFYQAKRVALGMRALMRRHFPQDTLDLVGFFTTAERLRERDLPLAMPKPVSLYDPSVRVRLPLDEAVQNPKRLPQHFTNLQLGLRLARKILSARGADAKQIFIVTDGQPTAHVEAERDGREMLYLLYPPSEKTTLATLSEALRCQQQGIRIATFALIEDYWGMDWVGFVDKLTRLTRGMAYYCASEDLSSTVIESYLNGRRRKAFVA